MSVTQTDVAAAGVGRTTVADVLSGRKRGGRISQEVSDRVRAVAQKLNYVPNRHAQALVSGKMRTVGLVVVGFAEEIWVWSRIAQGAQTALIKAGYDTLIHGIAPDAPRRRNTREENATIKAGDTPAAISFINRIDNLARSEQIARSQLYPRRGV